MKRMTLISTLAIAALSTAAAAQQVQKPNASDQGKSSTPTSMPAPTPSGTVSDDAYYGYAWTAMDANADGRVSRDEYMAYHNSRWDRYDSGKRGYFGRDDGRRLMLEREMSKTDGQTKGSPLNPTTKK